MGEWAHLSRPLDRLADLLGVQTVDLMEFRPLAAGEHPGHATRTPCPAWCTSHDLLAVHGSGLRGEVDVFCNKHRHVVASGPFTATLTQLGYTPPNTFLDIEGPEGASWRLPPTGEVLEWLAGKVRHMSELFGEVAALPGLA